MTDPDFPVSGPERYGFNVGYIRTLSPAEQHHYLFSFIFSARLFLNNSHPRRDKNLTARYRLHMDVMTTAVATPSQLISRDDVRLQRKNITWSSLAVGAAMNIFQVSTLGQPLENVKTYVSSSYASRDQYLLH